MPVTASEVKQLHMETGAGYMEAKRALEQAGGDWERARLALLAQGAAVAQKKAGRRTGEGRIEVYRHPGDRVAAMLELNCESDFAAATEAFRALAHNLAMQVAAMNPDCVSAEDIPPETLRRERSMYEAQARAEQAPESAVSSIVEGRLRKYFAKHCLLDQPYIRDGGRSVRDEVNACIAALQENVSVKRFKRFELGE